MADPHTLKIGDIVCNPIYWPHGETARVIEIRPFRHFGLKKGKGTRLRPAVTVSRTERVIIVDHAVRDISVDEKLGENEKFSNQWMEAGLDKIHSICPVMMIASQCENCDGSGKCKDWSK